jgi:trimeric autotransporter adhesin
MVAFMILGVVLLPACGGGGGGGGVTNNPMPSVSSLSPTQQAMGSQSQTLTINGSGFISGSAVTYNSNAHTASVASGSQMTISLNANDMSTLGPFPVVVTNPSPGGGASSATNFNVVTGTPVGTFPVTVTAVSGTAPNQTTHTATFNLVVQ